MNEQTIEGQVDVRRRQCGRVLRTPDLKSGSRGFMSNSNHYAGVVSRLSR